MSKTEILKLRVTPEELEEIRNKSEAAGISMSDFVRKRIFSPLSLKKYDEVAALLLDIRRHLGRSGSVLSQAIRAGQGGQSELEEYRSSIRQLGKILRRFK